MSDRWGSGRAALILLAASALLSAGCAAEVVAAPEPTPTEPGRPAPASIESPSPLAFAPLTGLIAESGALAHPSLAAKLDNHVEARPHIALNRADIVFEELVEGGITRYLAVWHSDIPEQLGPVRSIRPMDPDIVTPFGGMIAYSGGQDRYVEMMMAAPVVNLVFDYDDSGLFERADDRPSPHDVLLFAQDALVRHSELPTPRVQFAYGSTNPLAPAAFAAVPTSRIELVFSEARFPAWEWDAAASAWLRFQEGEPDIEDSGARVTATNVVTLRVGIEYDGDVPRTVMVSSGEAWVSSGGRTAHGTWSKTSPDAPIALVADSGEPLRLAPGRTWVELVPVEGSATFTP